jgi:hypothetical protein
MTTNDVNIKNQVFKGDQQKLTQYVPDSSLLKLTPVIIADDSTRIHMSDLSLSID